MNISIKTALTIATASILIIAIGLSGCQKKEPTPRPAPTGVADKTSVLASIPDDHKPTQVDSTSGDKPAFSVLFNDSGTGAAYIAQLGESYHVVHNGKLGAPTMAVDRIAISPDGKRMAYSAQVDGRWGMFIDGQRGVDSDEVGNPVFSPDGKHIAYWGKLGDKWFISVDGVKSERTRPFIGEPAFSADSSRLVYIEEIDEAGGVRLVISDLGLKELHVKPGIGTHMIMSPDMTRIATVSKADEKQRVIEFSIAEPEKVKEGQLYDEITYMAFAPDSASVAYIARIETMRYVVHGGRQEELPSAELMGRLVVRPDNKAVGMILADSSGMYFHQAFTGGSGEAVRYVEAAFPAYSGSGDMHAYAARKDEGWFIVVNGKAGPSFDRVVTPTFSPEGKRLVYRVRHEGRRFVVVADTEGGIMKRHPEYEMVFAPVFTADGKSVAYGVKDGRDIVWKVEALD